jgi:integrase
MSANVASIELATVDAKIGAAVAREGLGRPGIDWGKLDPEAQEAVRHARADSTLRAYGLDWAQFGAWCRSAGRRELPADAHDVASYLAHLGGLGRSVSTIQRAAAAIAFAHRVAGASYDARHAVLLETMQGLRRKLGTAPENQKTPLGEDLVARVCAPLGPSLIDVRDRALLLLGFLSACRASNLVALDVADATFSERGVDLLLRRSKVDQTGEGFMVAVPVQSDAQLCASRALRAWLDAAHVTEGSLFRVLDRHGHVGGRMSVQDVRRVLRRRMERAGLTPTGSKEFGSHSLRSGFCTSAAEAGRSIEQIMTQTGHKRADSAIRYVRHANRYANNAASGLLGTRREGLL